MEQRYHAVMEVISGAPVTEVAAYGTGELWHDLERFIFLLGGSNGEPLFGP
jgi:hypothetical protein